MFVCLFVFITYLNKRITLIFQFTKQVSMRFEENGMITPVVLSYKWEAHMDYRKNDWDEFISPIFATRHYMFEHKWRLHLSPNGNEVENRDYVSIFLQFLGKEPVEVSVKLSLLDDNYLKVIEREFHHEFKIGCRVSGFPRFAKYNFVCDNRILLDSKMKILCEIVYDEYIAEPPLKKTKTEQDSPDYCRLQEFDEFEKLLTAENSTDFAIRIGTDEIRVHRAIIMTRSPVFQAMLEHEMKEKQQNFVVITDVKHEVMKEVVRFMYTGKVEKIDKMALRLLFAAEKYCLNGLKLLCERQLQKNIKERTAIEYLKIAHLCNAVDLKSKIIQFIVKNHENVVHKLEFKLLPSELMYEVLTIVLGKNGNK